MEFNKIEILIEKYFQGETSIADENDLRSYFLSQDIAPHLQRYKAMFRYFAQTKKQEFAQETLQIAKKRKVMWRSVAASIVFLFGLATFFMINTNKPVNKQHELGTYENPEIAFKETQKALALLSSNVNLGIESVRYVQEYETTKKRVFK
ncbi:conserved hypothetical protein [Flavobacterium psychrophilum]|uniref:hypothetical protein n=1 Tax=Flavobacterium psychrophilum TaxID=96345 RepID=UPI000B7C5659|nr:hypothetical protein [Flavobacterium psychrophilum]EKT4550304.1 hypothetical protein [Flavobacterium psychrophilum]SNB05205.1 conserved hypothetical protein [Flavobacterium psychrophilum]SNB28303.1 conserved hypothetical protein [Flavobacterium psychrophilum]